MPITKATQSVITPNIATTDTRQTITGEKVIQALYSTSSTTSLTIGTGSKTLTVGTGLTWVAGRVATIRNGTSTTRFMTGSVTSYDSATGVMVVNVTTVGSGTGTYTAWVVSQDSSTALPALLITSNDSANAFVVEDSTNPDATPFLISNNGNTFIGRTTWQTDFFAPKLTVGSETGSQTIGIESQGLIKSTGSASGSWDGFAGDPINGTRIFTSGWDLDPNSFDTSVLTSPVSKTFFGIKFFPTAINQTNVYNLADNTIFNSAISYLLGSSYTVAGIATAVLKIDIFANIYSTVVATGQQSNVTYSYTFGSVVVNPTFASATSLVGFTANNLTTLISPTVNGYGPTAGNIGGYPAGGYAQLQATAGTISAAGQLNLTLRGHTTADGATTYQSKIFAAITLDSYTLLY